MYKTNVRSYRRSVSWLFWSAHCACATSRRAPPIIILPASNIAGLERRWTDGKIDWTDGRAISPTLTVFIASLNNQRPDLTRLDYRRTSWRRGWDAGAGVCGFCCRYLDTCCLPPETLAHRLRIRSFVSDILHRTLKTAELSTSLSNGLKARVSCSDITSGTVRM